MSGGLLSRDQPGWSITSTDPLAGQLRGFPLQSIQLARRVSAHGVSWGNAGPARAATVHLAPARLKYLFWCPSKPQPPPCPAEVAEERMVAARTLKFITNTLTPSRCSRISCLKLWLYSLFHTGLSAPFAARYETVITMWETSGGSSSLTGCPGQPGTCLTP